MKKNIVILFLIFFGLVMKAQTNNSKWSDLFSYNNVLAFKESNGKIIAATENGIFYYDTVSGEITKLSKANGLHEVKISAFDYNPSTNTALIGYQSGNLDVVTGDGVTYIVDIPLSQSYTGSKTINNISINGDKAVLSLGYGVSIFNLTKKEFGDTCFFFNGASYEKVNEAVIKDNTIYAVTGSGLKYHTMDVTFSVYTGWNTLPGSFTQIDSGSVLVLATPYTVYYGGVGTLNALPQSFTNIKDVKIGAASIVVTDQAKVSVYNLAGNLQKSVDISEELNTANLINGKIYAGTKYSGILDESNNSYKPDGPYSNTSYKLQILDDKLWVSNGGREARYNVAASPMPNLGFYFFDGKEWIYPSYFKNNPVVFNLLDVVPNPINNEVYITNYNVSVGQGIYKFNYNSLKKDFDFVKYYQLSKDNDYNLNRPVGLSFDENNNLIGSMAFSISYTDVSSSLLFYDKSSDSFQVSNLKVIAAAQKPIFYENLIWLPTPRANYFVIYDFNKTFNNFSDDKTYVLNAINGLPDSSVGSLSVSADKNGDVWIGTDRGLRVLSNAVNAIENNPKAEPIIINQNGISEELFKDLQIIQIEVDSGNQKWVSVEGGGVFYLSANGEKTIQHFTKVNSPLPNDTVTDIKVDPKTGKVYFCTYDGIVVYQGDVINVTSNFGNIKVYPNPVVAAQYKGNVKITGLAEKTNIRITDAAGNVVHQAIARGGFYEWNLNNQRGVRVASGVYFVLMTNEDATDTATAKIAVVN
jgi:hypothetical protein